MTLYDHTGKPIPPRPLLPQAARRASTACPQCKAPQDKRVNTAGFGPPIWNCGECGYQFDEVKA